jgi:hypothetical protein
MKSEYDTLIKEFESKADELKRLHAILDAKIEKLQIRCPHKRKSRWRKIISDPPMPQFRYKSCLNCGKILDRKGKMLTAH